MKSTKKFIVSGLILTLLISVVAIIAYAANDIDTSNGIEENPEYVPNDPYLKTAIVEFVFDGVYRDVRHCTGEDYQNRVCATTVNQDEENLEYYEHITEGKPYAILDNFTGNLENKLIVDCEANYQGGWGGSFRAPENWHYQLLHYCDISREQMKLAYSRQDRHFFVDEKGYGSGSSYFFIKNEGSKDIVLRSGREEFWSERNIYGIDVFSFFHGFDYETGEPREGEEARLAGDGVELVGDNSYQIAFKLFGEKWSTLAVASRVASGDITLKPGQTLAVRYDYKVKPYLSGPWSIWDGNTQAVEISKYTRGVTLPTFYVQFTFFETL